MSQAVSDRRSPARGKTVRVDGPGRSLELQMLDDPVTQFVFNEIFRGRCYMPPPFITQPQLILDIGANIGLAAAFFGLAFPNAQIHCFEPDPAALALLRINAARVGNCTIHPFGLYNENVRKQFFTGDVSTAESSIHNTGFNRAVSEPVELKSAGELLTGAGLSAPDIVKLDTEGCELEILMGMRRMLGTVKLFFIEFHSERDRHMIDQYLAPTHSLWRGTIYESHRGEFCFVRRDLVPAQLRNAPLT